MNDQRNIISPSELRAWRESLGKTQEFVARRSNVTLNTISNIERETHFPTLRTYQKVIRALREIESEQNDNPAA